MESRFIYHDDPFDGNYQEFDTESPFWTNDTGNLGLQLTETLHGILPIAPRDVASANLISNSALKGDYSGESKISQPTIFENCDDDEHLKKNLFSSLQGAQYSYQDDDVDNNSDSFPITNVHDIDSSYDEENSVDNDYFNVRICSRSTFRSRTDSSSIGDYESHSSDYDEDSDSVELNAKHQNHFLFHEDIREIQNIEVDTDPFALQLDVNTFDLATFITSEEPNLANSAPQTNIRERNIKNKVKYDSDSDSDVIVDVETLESEDTSFMELIQKYENDNKVKCNSWISGTNTKEKIHTKPDEPIIDIPIPINGPQKHKQNEDSVREKQKSQAEHQINYSQIDKNAKIKETTIKSSDKLLVQEKNANESVCKTKNYTRAFQGKHRKLKENVLSPKHDQRSNDFECKSKVVENEFTPHRLDVDSSTFPKKRKLNLTEYKKRQKSCIRQPFPGKLPGSIKNQERTPNSVCDQPAKQILLSTECHPPSKECVNPIIKPLETVSSKKALDPITEAKNKALRVQELKRAQHIKAIDSTVSSKVARVTKLLPLEEIVRNSGRRKKVDDCVINSSQYEEIITYSVGSNTDITFATAVNNIQQSPETNPTQLKYNELLTDIRNSFQKVCSDESVIMTRNSLITSINDVVIKKTSPQLSKLTQVCTSDIDKSPQAEDKIIMHLRKDRIRIRKPTQCTQTDILPEFPILHLLKPQASKHNEEQQDRRKNGPHEETNTHYLHQNSSREHFTLPCRERSRSKSSDRSYNRKSRSRTKSSTRTMYREDFDKNVSAPAVEERRIVYVGRIEQETTKEALRRKFASYGPIKHITIRYKDTGLNYGFITFTNSEDAFRVIDNYKNDSSISMYDISFGGRRAFCRSSYADLDNAGLNMYQSCASIRPAAQPVERDSFEVLLSQMKAKLQAV